MRQIKFRAWRERYNSLGGKMYSHKELLKLNDWDNLFHGKSIFRKFQQFTGLRDKNGKEIYENDILKLWLKNKPLWITNIFWSDDLFGWDLEEYGVKFTRDDWLFGDIEFEVIGNLYENSDLLPPTNYQKKEK